MSGFLLDTNLISEVMRPRPNPQIAEWILQTDEQLLHLSVLTLGEIRTGVELLPQSSRRASLEAWLDIELPARFQNRILDIDKAIAHAWGRMTAKAAQRGRPLPDVDGLLAATALHHNLVLVTRNSRDVEITGVSTLNPWNA